MSPGTKVVLMHRWGYSLSSDKTAAQLLAELDKVLKSTRKDDKPKAGGYQTPSLVLADGSEVKFADDAALRAYLQRSTTPLASAEQVDALYRAVLGRGADAGGVTAAQDALAASGSPQGGSLDEVRRGLASSAEAAARVGDLYRAVLGREAGAAEVTGYQAALARGETLDAVRSILAHSAEARADLGEFYRRELGREADAGGLAAAQDALTRGETLGAVGAGLAASAEAGTRVGDIYRQVLGREVDVGGLAEARGVLARGGSLSAVRAAVAGSAEAGAAAGEVYRRGLGREASAGEVAGVQDGLARGETLEAVRLSVAGSAEASARVSGVFEAVLGRASEGANAAWMGDALARGGSVSELRAGLAYSAEATGAVRGVYLQTLGRDADAAGLAHWQERLAGGLSLAEVRAALASSAEAVARVSPPSVESPAPGGGSAPPGPAAETAPASGGATDAGSGVEPGAAAPGDTGGVSGAGLAGAAAGFARTGATLATPLIESATGGGLTSALTSTLVGAGVVVGAGAAATGVYLATRGEVGVVPVDGYDGTTPGTAPISAEVNGVRGTVLLYRGATTDTPDLAGQRTVTLGVDADGATLRDARGVAVGRLEDGRVVPGEGVSVPDLLRDPAVSTPPLGAGLGEPVDGIVPTPTGGPTGGDGAARPGDGASATPQGGTGSAEVSGGGDPAVPGYGIPTDDDREDVLVLSMWAQGAGKEATETALENLRLGRAMTTDGGGAGGPPGDATAVGGSGQGGTAVGLGPDGDDRGDAGSASATDAAKPSAAPEAQATTGTERTAQVGRNEATWTVDAQGRPIGVEATLREVTSGAQRGSAELKAQTTVKALGLPDDDAGHVVGHRFMLDQGLSNLFPQNANLNRGAYKTFENEVADWIKAGGEVHFTANLSAGSADRPDTIRVSYEVLNPATGRTVYEKVVEFDNKEGQEFDRVPSRDMADYFK